MKTYSITPNKDDFEIKIRLPNQILKHLAMRAGENGYSIETEIARRLARTLERDLEMIEEDNDIIVKAFERCEQDKIFPGDNNE